jgi:CheY-like chemotaxis protein
MLASQKACRPELHKNSVFEIRRPIVIVDDSPEDRFFLSRFLHAIIPGNTPVVTLRNGKELLQYLADVEISFTDDESFTNETPSMIFMDLFMPQMNGIETLKALRSQALWADTPVTLVTSSCDDVSILKAEDAGANAFMSKPFSRVDVLQALQKINNFSRVMV